MLFEEKTFKGFVNTEIADTKKQCEVLLSLEAATKEEVDEMAAKAVAAGCDRRQPAETAWRFVNRRARRPECRPRRQHASGRYRGRA